MDIYIEDFLLQNIVINLCLLKIVESTTKYYSTFYKLLLASILGSVFSVIASISILNNLILNIIKFVCAIIMLKTAFKLNFKQFLTSFILLFIFTYALGGAVMNLTSATYITNLGVVCVSKLNLTNICCVIIVVAYIFDLVARNLKNQSKTNNYIYSIQLELNKHKIKLNAYLDSGNLLEYNNKPVMIIDKNSYLKLVKTDFVKLGLTSNSISTNTITGTRNLQLIKIDKIIIYSKKKIVIENQYIAINSINAFKNSNYQALLSPLML